jgi:hypothetical protein
MKQLETSCFDDNGNISVKAQQIGFAGWEDPPNDVLASVDDLLRLYGLEVVVYRTGSDSSITFSLDKAPAALWRLCWWRLVALVRWWSLGVLARAIARKVRAGMESDNEEKPLGTRS